LRTSSSSLMSYWWSSLTPIGPPNECLRRAPAWRAASIAASAAAAGRSASGTVMPRTGHEIGADANENLCNLPLRRPRQLPHLPVREHQGHFVLVRIESGAFPADVVGRDQVAALPHQ